MKLNIKEIGQKNKMSPIDIYTTLRNHVESENETK
jgi:hypothetical protein